MKKGELAQYNNKTNKKNVCAIEIKGDRFAK